jgi:tryptophanyl-tRNA synthetase
MSKPVILTGLRANNDLHLGNYLGALLPMVYMATTRSKDYVVNLMMADLHSFNTPVDHQGLHAQIMDNLKTYAAAGLPLDIDDVRIFRESYVPAHSELSVILSNFSGFGELSRMTQFKDKAAKLANERVSAALFNYPVLMASDILLYNTSYVPVGDDQSQHLEFARDISERMNNRFASELFTIPEPVQAQHTFFGKDQGLRIKDLLDPTKKMSKSDETGRGVIFLNDTPEAAAKKIMSAATDSLGNIAYDPKNQPGISNLIDIYTALTGDDLEVVKTKYEGQTQYGVFKQDVAEAVAKFLQDFQEALAQVDIAQLAQKLESSEKSLNEVANQTLLRVQQAVGLRER